MFDPFDDNLCYYCGAELNGLGECLECDEWDRWEDESDDW
jgi:hypothetical protein